MRAEKLLKKYMKKKSLLIVGLLLLFASSFAQLSVDPLGKVKIVGNRNRSLEVGGQTEGIYVARTGQSASSSATAITGICDKDGAPTSIGVEGKSVSSSQTHNSLNVYRSYGVLGTAGHGGMGWNFGVFGRLQNSNGAGVYGSAVTNDLGRNLSVPYAGYFNGNVQVVGDLQVTGLVSGMVLGASVSPMSVASLLTDDLETTTVSEKLSNLSVIPYYKEQPVALVENLRDDVNVSPNWISDLEMQSYSKKHYALSAEQLEEIFPEFVYTNADNSKSIDYVGMIPLLLQSINELNAEVAELRGRASYAQKKETTSISQVADTDISIVSQNTPNPWSTSTDINLSVADNVQTAVFYVYDLTGKQVFEKVISERGNSSLKLTSADFTPGMYIYSLITDGKLIETKRMIVTK